MTHNTKLFILSPPLTTAQFSVPVGHHVNIRTVIEDTEILRPYTPVTDLNNDADGDTSLRFLIKIYPDGAVTPGLGRLRPGDLVSISDHLGSFSMTQIPGSGSVTLLAAGTGITPMVAILTSLRARKQRPQLRLITFDRSPEDIIWKDQVGLLAISDCDIFTEFPCQLAVFQYKNSDWVSVTHVVTSPSEGWDGETGRISEDILRKYIGDNKTWVGLCGPPGFNREAVRLLKLVRQLETEHIHVFEG